MEDLYSGLGTAVVVLSFLGGIALIFHGFNIITVNIHKHYYNDKQEVEK